MWLRSGDVLEVEEGKGRCSEGRGSEEGRRWRRLKGEGREREEDDAKRSIF